MFVGRWFIQKICYFIWHTSEMTNITLWKFGPMIFHGMMGAVGNEQDETKG